MTKPMVWDGHAHTGAGRSKRRPPPRPAGDSLPRFDCGVAGCGTVGWQPTTRFVLELTDSGGRSVSYQAFCSWGCLGRFAALQEVRQ